MTSSVDILTLDSKYVGTLQTFQEFSIVYALLHATPPKPHKSYHVRFIDYFPTVPTQRGDYRKRIDGFSPECCLIICSSHVKP